MNYPSFESEMTEFLGDMGFNDLPKEKQQEVLAQLKALVEEEVEFELDQIVPDTEKDHFAGLSKEEQDEYLDELGIDREEIAYQKTQALKTELQKGEESE
ncbi:MAG: hypothetical protein ACK4NC_01000 [Candidatus Gracilibacteria bacterium]